MAFPVQCGCGARFALGLLRCPRCRAVSPQYAKSITKEQDMPRITVAGGPSNADALPGEVGYIGPVGGVEHVEADPDGLLGEGYGGHFEGVPFAAEDVAAQAPEAPAVPAAHEGTGPDDNPPGDGPVPDHASKTVAELRAAAKDAGLPTTGTKAELVQRLTAATEPASGGAE